MDLELKGIRTHMETDKREVEQNTLWGLMSPVNLKNVSLSLSFVSLICTHLYARLNSMWDIHMYAYILGWWCRLVQGIWVCCSGRQRHISMLVIYVFAFILGG